MATASFPAIGSCISKVLFRLSLLAGVLATLALGASAPANTISGLTVEDISSEVAVTVLTDFTIVEWDGYEDGGVEGNTVNTTTGEFFSHTAQGVDGLFWRRVGQGIPPDWVGLGGSNQRYRGESIGPDDDLLAQNTTTITGLDASKIYDFYYIGGGRKPDTRNYKADFGPVASTSRSSQFALFHIAGLGEDPEDAIGQAQLGFYAVPIGTTSGSSSVEVSLESSDGAYWMGVGYAEVGSANFDIVSVDHVAGTREAVVTWNSSEGTNYTVEASNDMLSWKELDDSIEVSIEDKDVRVDTFRSSGAGGQHVNVTDSAVRLTHLPSGIVVSCQNERSQHRNREMAMKVLRSRLYEAERRKRDEKRQQEEGEKKGIDFGSQIRSYILQPYRLVKDHRTGCEIGDVNRVLDGDLDTLIHTYLLRFSTSGQSPATPTASKRNV